MPRPDATDMHLYRLTLGLCLPTLPRRGPTMGALLGYVAAASPADAVRACVAPVARAGWGIEEFARREAAAAWGEPEVSPTTRAHLVALEHDGELRLFDRAAATGLALRLVAWDPSRARAPRRWVCEADLASTWTPETGPPSAAG